MLLDKNSIHFFKPQNFSSLTEMNLAESMPVILSTQSYRKSICKRPEYSSLYMTQRVMVTWPKTSWYNFYRTLYSKDQTTINTAWKFKRNFCKLACKKSCSFWTPLRLEKSSSKILFFRRFFKRFLSTKTELINPQMSSWESTGSASKTCRISRKLSSKSTQVKLGIFLLRSWQPSTQTWAGCSSKEPMKLCKIIP